MDERSAVRAVVEALRDQVTEGALRPGTQLREEHLATSLRASRHTVREAFRLLQHEGLLVHVFHRGVFVAELTDDDLRDLYGVRRLVEPAVLRGTVSVRPAQIARLRAVVEEADRAAEREDWAAVGTANARFHQLLVRLAESPRLDAMMRVLSAEQRLAFAVVRHPEALHHPFVQRNREILDLVAEGKLDRAADALEVYLDDAERFLLEARDEAPDSS